MRFRRLKLSGFKSFVEPSELRIEPGLTGVVGPNGCGKSNLLEAIRWVMGESSPKSLRGGGMEDVIFAGTASRPARGFAEVVLFAQDSDGEDLEVVRRIERGAGSAYRINGRDARARDVALTFADAATGAHSPALVSQGRIASVVSAKPVERRAMLEEAAGIAGLHVRRKDAEQKLRATETNLSRLQDLMEGLDRQIAQLRRQARAAERYKAVSEKIGTAEARLIFARWRDASAAADAAKAQAQAAEDRVGLAHDQARDAQARQAAAAAALAQARDDLADRRDDASAHGHRMATLQSQLDAAEEQLATLDRQRERLEADRGDADRLTRDAADALSRLERELAEGSARLAADEAARPGHAEAVETAERAARSAELALAQATAHQAGIDAEWRIADAERDAAAQRLARIEREAEKHAELLAEIAASGDPEAAVATARADAQAASQTYAASRTHLAEMQASKDAARAERDLASENLAAAKAEFASLEREHAALARDRDARAKRALSDHGLPAAIDAVRAAPGYERAVAAVLGRDAKAPLGSCDDRDGRFWTGASPPQSVPGSLAEFVTACPPQLAARLALVHFVAADDGRALAPGEWLVTREGHLRRWDGFVARGEGAAEAARLEAENRLADLASRLPGLESAVTAATERDEAARSALADIQTQIVALEREAARCADTEREALRRLDREEAACDRLALRRAELEEAGTDLAERRRIAQAELEASETRRGDLPDPEAGRSAVESARARSDAARTAAQGAMAALAAHDQALAVIRERTAAQRADRKNWQERSGDAARRLSETAQRLEDIEQERAVVAAKPPALLREIEAGDTVRARVTAALSASEEAMALAAQASAAADAALAEAQEALSAARETRAGAAARAENEAERRREMARISGERFQCPPPMLPGRFAFEAENVGDANSESADMDRLVAERERIGPVNLIAADELAEAESQHGSSVAEQAELHEAVNRLRGSIGNLNREGRERLRTAFENVDRHFQALFGRLFQGGQAHLALVDSDDPLEAGLEIYAQPPGKRLQSLTLLSGGEQALTAVALIFALFLTNPAPICVLDEVDAPLDDANIERFCDLLDAMVARTETRYLIVTHNAVTMSRMHRLFGVTMVEHGVSRLVSVDLGGAEELLAAE